jgi:hypothetical protein
VPGYSAKAHPLDDLEGAAYALLVELKARK